MVPGSTYDVPSRALVLGGGGITGIAWEIGILTGLLEAGVDLHLANIVIGTSAGSFVGVAFASGYDMMQLYAAQSEPTNSEITVSASKEVINAWRRSFEQGGDNPQLVGMAFGTIAKTNPEPISMAQRRITVEGRLVTTTWPSILKVTAMDADTGELHVFDQSSGISLVDAVSASGAVPGVWPLMNLAGKRWIDGGMVSSANARLADGYERVLVLAPMPNSYGAIPGAQADVQAMNKSAAVMLIAPDEASLKAIGYNPYEFTHQDIIAAAGRNQGNYIADSVKAIW